MNFMEMSEEPGITKQEVNWDRHDDRMEKEQVTMHGNWTGNSKKTDWVLKV